MKLSNLRITLGAIALGVFLIAPMTASAQRDYNQQGEWGNSQGNGNWGNQQGRDRDYQRGNRGNDYRRGQNFHIRALVDDAERDSNSMRYVFEHSVNRWRNFDRNDRDDRGRNRDRNWDRDNDRNWDRDNDRNWDRNDRSRDWDRRNWNDAKSAIQHLDESMETLRHAADDYRPRASRDEMSEVLRRAEIFSDFFARRRDVREVIGDRWEHLRVDINRLAQVYGLSNVRR